MARRKKAHEKEGQDYGGEDAPADEGAITEVELAAGWNLGTVQPSDRAKQVGGLLGEELPPEDESWLSQFDDVPPSQDPTLDGLIQPSLDAVAGAMSGWLRGVARVTATSPGARARGWLTTRSAPLLQDPFGRLVLGRARAAALGMISLLSAPFGFPEDPRRAHLVRLVLELEAREPSLRAAAIAHGDKPELPSATALFGLLCPSSDVDAEPKAEDDPSPASRQVFEAALTEMIRFPDPTTLVPRLLDVPPDEDDPDDEFGIDAVIAEMTGGRADRAEPVYRAAVQAAEKTAVTCAWLRARQASVAALIVELAALIGAPPPRSRLDAIVARVDSETQSGLQICLEVARAANRRSLAPPALHNGLKRATAVVVKANRNATNAYAGVAASLVPGAPQLPPPPLVPRDPLAEAWHDGAPTDAIAWLETLPPTADRAAAIAFTQIAVQSNPEDAIGELDRLIQLCPHDPALAWAARIALGAALLWDGQPDRAAAIAAHHRSHAESRRNGILYAEATLLLVEALVAVGRPDEAEAVRVEGGAKLAAWGARGALTLLARWTPPAANDD